MIQSDKTTTETSVNHGSNTAGYSKPTIVLAGVHQIFHWAFGNKSVTLIAGNHRGVTTRAGNIKPAIVVAGIQERRHSL